MVLIAVELHSVDKILELSVDAHVEVSLLAHILEKLLVVALAVFHQRGEKINFLTVIFLYDEIDDLLAGVFLHRLAR